MKASPFGDARPVTTTDRLSKLEQTASAPPPGGEPASSNRYVPPSRRVAGDAAPPATSAPQPSAKPASDAAEPSGDGGASRYVPPSRRGGDAVPSAGTPYTESARPPPSRFPQEQRGDGRYPQQQQQRGGPGGFDQRPSGGDGGGRFGGGASGHAFDRPREGGGGFRDGPPREGGGRDGGRQRYEGGGGGSGFRDMPRPSGSDYGNGNSGPRRSSRDLPPEERREFPGAPPPASAPVEVDRERFKGLAPAEGDYPAPRQGQQFPGAFGGGGDGYDRPPMPGAFQGGGPDRGGQARFGGGRDGGSGGGYDRPSMPSAFQGGNRDGGTYDRSQQYGGGGGERPQMPSAFQMGSGRRDRDDGPGGGRLNPTGSSSGRQGDGSSYRRPALPPPTEGGKQELGNFIGKTAPAASSNTHHSKPAAAPTAEPVADDAVQAAAAIGIDFSRATMAKKLRPVLDEYLTDTSKLRDKKATAAITALRTPDIAADVARIFVEHALAQEKSGDRKQLAVLLNAIRSVKPIPLVSDAEIGAGLSTAIAAITDGPGSDAGARLKHFADEFGKAPKNALVLPADVQVFVTAATAAADAVSAAAASAAAAEAEIEGGAAASASAAAASAAAADAPDESATVDIAAIAAWLIKMDGKGLALRSEAQEKLSKVPAAKVSGPVMAAILKHASASGILTIKSPFLAKEQFGHLLKWLCYDSLAASVEVLVELQLIVNELGFPKGLLAGTFMKLYEEEIIDEPAFWAWKDDRRDTAGKSKALIDAVRFFTWLEEAAADEDEGEEDSEVEEALKDIVRPNNSNKLR